jgi:hypothetical protein
MSGPTPFTSLANIAKSLQTFTKLFTHKGQHLANQGSVTASS